MIYAIIGVVVLLIDQVIKYYTVANIDLNTGIQSLIPGVIHLTYIKNFGALFGVLQNASWLRWVLLVLMIIFTALMITGLCTRWLRTGFSRLTGMLLLAGILGNGIDRAIYGYVVDMFEFDFMNFAIFNLADCIVLIFGILFCVSLICGGLGRPDEDDEYDEDDEDEEEEELPRQPVRVRRPAPAAAEMPAAQPRRVPAQSAAPAAPAARPAQRPAQRPAAPAQNAAPVRPARPAAPTAPAAQEKPVQRPAQPAQRVVQRAAAPAPAPRPTAPAAAAAPAPERRAAPAPVAPVRREPEKPAEPVRKPAPKPAEDEFDLDSILAEFK